MTIKNYSVVEIRNDSVKSVAGDSSERIRSRFAREAESLQERAMLIGKAIGMTAVVSVAVSKEKGGIAFRFARDSGEDFDAKGILVEGDSPNVSSLLKVLK
ncbi:MAG: hypothetical protein MI807_13185 [Verrucomicrobiales bacterium]|nr:hypothetical protein [Verrucomicrobiales bacterium]